MLGGVFLGTMFYAALPLFEKFLEEGALFDKFVAYFFYTAVLCYPALAILCFSFEQVTKVRLVDGEFELETYKRMLFMKWAKRKLRFKNFAELEITNWKGAVNTASIKAEEAGVKDRYATKGHWMLIGRPSNESEVVIERRARKDDIEWLLTQMESHFA